MKATCPACNATLEFDDKEVFEVGETADCDECDTELEVVSAAPLTFEVAAYDEDEDEDEEEDEDLDDDDPNEAIVPEEDDAQ